jgi:dTDP-4-amino-4,6-dideoxygalactose transaminase
MSENQTHITLSDTSLGEEEALAAAQVVRSGWLSQGEQVAAFEREFAEWVGVKHAIAVGSCTVALELAMDVIGVSAGDEVIVPALTFVAAANAARRLGAVIKFADIVSEQELTLDPESIARMCTAKTKAIVPVHFAGFSADIQAIQARCPGVMVVEDCAHAQGARHKGSACGALAPIGAFSFFANKNMTTGEGGMITTHDDALAAQLKLIRGHGMTTSTLDRHRGHAFTYDVAHVGTNARMDEIRAAIGRVQLRKLRDNNALRRVRSDWYRARLSAVRGVTIPFASRDQSESAHHLFVILLPVGIDRSKVMTQMRASGVQTSVHYPLTHRFTAHRATDAQLPVSESIEERLLTLPLFPSLSHEQQERVCVALELALSAQR